MVSKRERLSGLYNGVRCRICGRKLTNPKSVQRQIGPICWNRLGINDNRKIKLTKSQTRCAECGMPMQDIRQIVLWRERWAPECAKYCCGCCPKRNDLPCPGDIKTKAWQEAQTEKQKQLEAYV